MKILLFGATGSAGGSVLRVCLADLAVEEVRAIVRRPLPLEHEKRRRILENAEIREIAERARASASENGSP